MSHFIAGDSYVSEGRDEVFPLKKVVAPRFKQIFRDEHRLDSSCNQTWAEEMMIASMCKKLSDKEYSKLRRQNADEIDSHFAKLKYRLRKQADSNASVASFFDQNKPAQSLNIKQLLRKMPVQIKLTEKYNCKLVNYAQTVSDLQQISTQKQNYKKWLDQHNNSPTKSPNYSRMSYVLERLHNSENKLTEQPVVKKAGQELGLKKALRLEGYQRRVKTLGSENSVIRI